MTWDEERELPARMILLRMRCDEAAMGFRLAALRLYLLLRAYNPDQPRVPAGYREGGQWTDGSFSLLPSLRDPGRRDDGDNVRIAAEDGDPRRDTINLEDEEAPKGIGHAIARHVSKSDAYLFGRMREDWWQADMPSFTVFEYAEAYGSFSSLADANELANRTLRENQSKVDAVASGLRKRDVIEAHFSEPTGYEAFRSDPEATAYMQTTYGVRMVIVHDRKNPRGYRIITAFPINDRRRRP